MATRVSADEVKEILDTTLTDSAIEAFIGAANLTVTKILGDEDLTDDELKEIERWLTAHLIACTRERQIMKEAVGQASVTYAGVTKTGLDATLYGQQVKLLDTTGLLAQQESDLGKRQASIYAVTSFDDTDEGLDG